ncbi:MAG: hypothetical protein HYU53_13970 [Acidobacteria bacterium]|nr:hypothetical protein [Acidobacteriota bacterium]
MTHLTPAEIVDALDGALSAGRASHARACAQCREEVERAASMLAGVRAVDAPEPSPLFWDHFSARVRGAVGAERARGRRGSWPWWMWAPLGSAAALALVAGLWIGQPGPSPHVARRTVAPPHVAEPHVAPSHVEEWRLLADLAEEMEWDEAGEAGFTIAPGAAEYALHQLSGDQQKELVRLLETEIDRLKSRG